MASMNFDFEALPTINEQCAAVKDGERKKRPHQVDETDLETAKCRYQPGVLVGDWFERRARLERPTDDWYTVYDSTYTCKLNRDFGKDKRAFFDNKERSKHGLGAEFLIEHYGKSFHKNFTTTNDLCYRVIPLELCGPRRRKYSSSKNLWLPENDLTKNFGNLTEFGLMEAVKCECYVESALDPRESVQKGHFKKPDASFIMSLKRIPKLKGNMNEPYLCHLDIDPLLPFRPHLIKTEI